MESSSSVTDRLSSWQPATFEAQVTTTSTQKHSVSDLFASTSWYFTFKVWKELMLRTIHSAHTVPCKGSVWGHKTLHVNETKEEDSSPWHCWKESWCRGLHAPTTRGDTAKAAGIGPLTHSPTPVNNKMQQCMFPDLPILFLLWVHFPTTLQNQLANSNTQHSPSSRYKSFRDFFFFFIYTNLVFPFTIETHFFPTKTAFSSLLIMA